MFKTFSLFLVYICCLHSILVLYVTNYDINKIYFTSLALWKQPCKCANYFVITVSNIYVCYHTFLAREITTLQTYN